MVGKPFYMMFNCLDGGVIEPIELDKSQLTDDRSIILLDEENQTVWLWHGRVRTLIQRRTALRQAESLKGHGYRAGNAIIGRDLNKIHEIDARKIDRVPEDTELNKKLMQILDKRFTDVGNLVYVEGTPDVDASAVAKPKPSRASSSVDSEKKKNSPLTATKVSSTSSSSDMGPSSGESGVKPSAKAIDEKNKMELLKGAMIVAVMEQYKDIWLSLKDDGAISIEQMDGKICSFKIKNGEVEFLPGSFAEVPSDVKAKIEERFEALTKDL